MKYGQARQGGKHNDNQNKHCYYTPTMLLEHLLSPEFDDPYEAAPATLLSAQATTASLLEQLGSPEHILQEDEKYNARQAFAAVTNPATPPANSAPAILKLKVPEAVKHLAGMLSQYDWDFVEQAKELRGYVVAQLLEETKHKDPRIRLKALELTGKLTEVASFTERSEVIMKTEDHNVIEERLRSRLRAMLPPLHEVQDTEVKEIAVVRHTPKAQD
jgi:hypothetical protein